MKKIFNTDVDDFEIIDLIVDYLDDDDLKKLLDETVLLRHQCKATNIKKYKFNRDVVEIKTKGLYRKDVSLKRSIIDSWNLKIATLHMRFKKNNDVDKFIKILKKDVISLELFEFCTLLWQKEEDYSELSNKLFEEYKEIVEIESNELFNTIDSISESGDFINMDKDIMGLSISECIQTLSKSKSDLESTQKELDTKYIEIEQLKKNLNNAIDTKELKKELKSMSKRVVEIDSSIKGENEKLKLELKNIKQQNEELKKEIQNINKSLSNFNRDTLIKSISKEFTDIQLNMNNTLKGSIIESVQKNIDNAVKTIEDKIDMTTDRIDNSICKETENEIVKGQVDISTPVIEEDDFSKLLDGLKL